MRKKIDKTKKLPVHIGIIMDGNGRWAKSRALPRSAGHSAGAKVFQNISRYANKLGIKYMTVYVFSTENWSRPREEIDNLMNILRNYLIDAKNYKDENMRVKFIGDISALPHDIIELMADAEEGGKDATGMQVNVAVNYGGRDEIVHAAQKIARDAKEGRINPEDVTERTVADNLYTTGIPDPDFIIRPSGEYRLSNFMTWQSAYSEFWFSDVLWPAFKTKHLDEAIAAFSRRERRFGGVGGESEES